MPHTGSNGAGYPWAKKAGHTITDLYPTEVPLISKEDFIQSKALQGLSLRDVALSVLNDKNKPIITHRMDMLFTHFGISGPAVLRCSQFVVKELMKGKEEVKMKIDLLPDETEDSLINHIHNSVSDHPKRTLKNLLKGLVPERMLLYILQVNNVGEEQKASTVPKEKRRAIVHDLKKFTFHVHGSQPIEKAFVTGGGISLKEIVPNTMQSKCMPGLFFCGEILDIHGYTGGYNITSALVTGRLAGMNAAWT